MKCVVFGASGQLGQALLGQVPSTMEVHPVSREQVDLADAQSIENLLESVRPSFIINAAAYTAVDRAEEERDLAFRVNRDAPASMASYACRTGAYLLHVSTDFVFDGDKSRPYLPGDPTRPLSVYGASKLAGENKVLELLPGRSSVLRTSWVYSATGKNFVKTMLRLFSERDVVSVVADQVGAPTSAASLAHCAWALAAKRSIGIHHWTDAGVASWYDFAVAIKEEGYRLNLIDRDVKIVPITTAEYPTQASRPAYSVLDRRATEREVGFQPLHWREKLREVLREMTK